MILHPSMVLLIPGMVLMFWAQNRVQGTYERYSQIPSTLGMTGAQVAQQILQRMGINDVKVEPIAGSLTDHYDPSARTVRLSEGVYGSSSLAAAAVAAHECGHVLQHVKGYFPMNMRAAVVPAANLGSNLGPFLVMGGLLANIPFLINVGIVLFIGVIAFHLVTLPVEFDASGRALKIVDELGILQGEERQGARQVLNAAAFTYVATAFYAVLQLIQLLMLRRD